MAASRIIINFSRWSDSDSGEEVVVIMRGKTGETAALRDHACSKLFLNVRGLLLVLVLVLVLCVGDRDFMVVTVLQRCKNNDNDGASMKKLKLCCDTRDD